MPQRADGYQTVQKALRVLEALVAGGAKGVGELAEALELDKSFVSRLLAHLAELGYVEQEQRRGPYRAGMRMQLLRPRGNPRQRLLDEAQGLLDQLALEARASAHLALPMGSGIHVLARSESPERIRIANSLGEAVSPHASGLGKVLLAHLTEQERERYLHGDLHAFTERTTTDREQLERELKRVHRRGVAFERGEEVEGVGCIAAPVFDADGNCVAALSISGPLRGTPFALDDHHAAMVTTTASACSQRIGYAVELQEVAS